MEVEELFWSYMQILCIFYGWTGLSCPLMGSFRIHFDHRSRLLYYPVESIFHTKNHVNRISLDMDFIKRKNLSRKIGFGLMFSNLLLLFFMISDEHEYFGMVNVLDEF